MTGSKSRMIWLPTTIDHGKKTVDPYSRENRSASQDFQMRGLPYINMP
jgi:hypothetical protein